MGRPRAGPTSSRDVSGRVPPRFAAEDSAGIPIALTRAAQPPLGRTPRAARAPAPERCGTPGNFPGARQRSLLRQTTARRRAAYPAASGLFHKCSYEISECDSHLLRRPKQAILGGLLGGPENLADIPQLQPLIMP